MMFGVIKDSVREGRVMEQALLEAHQRGGCGELLGRGGLDPTLFAFSCCFACNFTHLLAGINLGLL